MVSFIKIFLFFLILILCINEKVISSINEKQNKTVSKTLNYNDNIHQLKSMIANDELHKNLTILEKLILESLEKDKLKYPVIEEGTDQLLDISTFKQKNFKNTNNKKFVIPTTQSSFHDIVKYEHLMKKQLIEIYNSNISDIIKKKIFIVRTLKTIKLMLIPLNSYKQNNDLKTALEELNDVFKETKVQRKEISQIGDHETYFGNLLIDFSEIKESRAIPNKGEALILGHNETAVMDTNDFFFTTNSNINFMESLDDITNQYGLGLINHLGPHLIGKKNIYVIVINLFVC
ncbi:cytoadherence linked asexual protein 3.1, putative [Plasmodium sp.]|nr:cytoadherence linked asexual protein 3.1, putative [Plasmodium sp.]